MAGITLTLYPNAGGASVVTNFVKFMTKDLPMGFDHQAGATVSLFGNVAINGPGYSSKRLWTINAEALTPLVLTNTQLIYRTWEAERAQALWVPDLRLQDETLPFDQSVIYRVWFVSAPKYTFLSKRKNYQVQFTVKELNQV